MSFQSLSLSEPLQLAIEDLGFEKPSEIQAKAIPLLLDYPGDFVGQAQTGTGKTGAFLLPLLEQLNVKSGDVEAIILCPTRELAQQVHVELEKFARHMDIRSTTVYGGVSYEKQIKAIKGNKAQIIVGTPGRVIDLIEKKVLKLNKCKKLVIDEADEMLNMGFLEDVQHIIEQTSAKRKIWMFSATMPEPIAKLVEKHFNEPKFIKVKKKTLSNENIVQYFCPLNRKDFAKGLRRVVESRNDCYGIVFCETRHETKRLAEILADNGISAMALNGDLSQNERDWAMKRFKERKVDLLICTDVAARGIDVSDITHVFNMGLPRQLESYVHRIGRTGRAGSKGESISFITPSELNQLKRVEKLTGQKVVAYKMPDTREIKMAKIARELESMNGLKGAIQERGDGFHVDECYSDFEQFFGDLSKTEALKVLFSYCYNRDIRQIEEGLNVDAVSIAKKVSGNSRRRSAGGGGQGRRSDRRRSSDRRSASGDRKSASGGKRSGERRSRRRR